MLKFDESYYGNYAYMIGMFFDNKQNNTIKKSYRYSEEMRSKSGIDRELYLFDILQKVKVESELIYNHLVELISKGKSFADWDISETAVKSRNKEQQTDITDFIGGDDEVK
jgi:hypothetical protein